MRSPILDAATEAFSDALEDGKRYDAEDPRWERVHPLGEWAEVWLSFYDADGNRTERVYRAKDRLPLGWEVAPDLYEALEPVFRDARLAEYFCANDVPEDHQVLVSFTMAELRKALAAYQHILSPQARDAENT